MSGATGAAGGATGGRPGAAQGGGGYGVPQPPAEHPASSTSLMPPVGPAGQGGATYGGQPATPPPSGAGGFSQPTTYAKGQPTPPRGTRVSGNTPPGGTPVPGGAARRPAAAPAAAGPGLGRTRKARLRITKADPWSVMKVSFLLSVAVGIIIIVAAAVLWMTLDSLGVFDSLTKTLKEVTAGEAPNSGINLMDYVGFGKVMTFTSLIAVVDVVLLTALSTLSAFIYNAAAGFTGGIELTLAEED
ncbi:DUF3566 domain-containing protein [Streptomyces sp. CB01881]|uniref:DUF3566 domain-containing protein n=1 Tax=Streptomyces sp. CB01881 TaxID=2078691 RepID=UPI000CDC1F3D|nr:DUF3566 domain-containing protein [Streptomyces sp. CB01881]AUY50742.1 hypothetical protein C2142_19355 [Streptomyces sp. CB01881]TYC74128.1 hypothetical protein EH183_19330 [Streptomyces sp. CB01881]